MPFADINGIRMNYSVSGEGEPVILITGFGGDINFFHSLVPTLSDRFKVIVFDNRGAGLTEYKGKFEWQDYVNDVLALLDHLSVYKVHMLGWSMGSQIAMEFAVQHPERLQSLTIVSAFEKRPARSSYMMNTMIDAGLNGASVSYIYAMVNAFSFTEDYFLAKEAKHAPVRTPDTTTAERLRDQMHCLDTFDLHGKLQSVNIPTLSIHGLSDIMVEPKLGDAIVSQIEGCRVLRIPNVGHIIHPSLYAAAFREFLIRNSKQ
jgi:3-oxoadipate enol-lactonase